MEGATQNNPPQDWDPMQKQNLRQKKVAKRQNPPQLQDGCQGQKARTKDRSRSHMRTEWQRTGKLENSQGERTVDHAFVR
jgi:hypothetical protein